MILSRLKRQRAWVCWYRTTCSTPRNL